MKDQALEYNTLLNNIRTMINNISELGINIDRFNKFLETIIYNVENNVVSSKEQSMAEAFLTLDYVTGIKELNRLKLILLEYDVYFKAINSCSYLEKQMEKFSDPVSIKLFSKQIIEVIKNIRNSSTLHYEDERSVIERVYETAYNIIKLEVIELGESEVYNFIKNNETDLYYISNLVKKEISLLDLNDERYSILMGKIHELNSRGLDKNQVDLDIIKLLLYYNGKLKYIDSRFKELLGEFRSNYEKMGENVRDYRSTLTSLDKTKTEISRLKRDILKRAVSFGICLSILGGGLFGINRFTKKICHYDRYKQIVTTYTSDGNITVEEKLIAPVDVQNMIHNSEITVRFVDNDYVFDNTGDYRISYDELDDDMKEIIKLYDGSFVEIRKSFVDRENVIDYFNELESNVFSVLVGGIYVALLTLILGGTVHKNVSKVIEYIKDFKYEKDDIRVFSKTLKSIKNEMLEIINSNDELKHLFVSLYEQNKHLIDNPTELYQRFEELEKKFSLSSDEIKKLVRTKA